jgi:hypothetical protein
MGLHNYHSSPNVTEGMKISKTVLVGKQDWERPPGKNLGRGWWGNIENISLKTLCVCGLDSSGSS